jgi:DNA-binding NarL/FixJ family response regulator
MPPAGRGADPASVAAIFVADHDSLWQTLIARAVAARPDLHVVGTAADGHAAGAGVAELRPRVLVLADDLPRCDALAWASELAATQSGTRVVLLCRVLEPALERRALNAGVARCVARSVESRDLADLLAAVAAENLA